MRHIRITVLPILVLMIAAAGFCRAPPDTDSNIAEQLKAVYKSAKLGTDSAGTHVLESGTILVIQKSGILGVPSSSFTMAPAIFKDGELHPPGAGGRMFVGNNTRFLDLGEKVYVLKLNVKEDHVEVWIQECDVCNQVSQVSSYKSVVSFRFQKGYLQTTSAKEIEDTISKVLKMDDSASSPAAPATAVQSAQAAAQLKLPAVYVNSQKSSDQLNLNADKTFQLQEDGQPYHGTFTEKGNSIELSINETNSTTVVTLQGSSTTDSSGHTWTLRN